MIGAHLIADRDASQVTAHTEAEARHVAGQLIVGVPQSFDPLPRVANWWLLQGRPLDREDWENDARLFFSTHAGLQTIAWVDAKGTRSWSVRPGGVPEQSRLEAPGVELQNAVAAAKAFNAIAVTKTFDSRGKASLYACSPIRRNGRLMGYIAGMYDVAELIRSVLQNQLPDDAIVTVRVDGYSFRFPPTRPASAAIEQRAPVPLAGAMWTVSASPSRESAAPLQKTLLRFGVLTSAFLYLCAVVARVSRRRAVDLQVINERLVFENHERRRAEEKVAELNRDLQRKLEEFRTLLEVLPIGIAVAEDPECHRIWTNGALAAMLNVQQGANISQSVPNPEKPPYRLTRNGVDVPVDDLPMQMAARKKTAVPNYYLDIVRADQSVLHTLSYSAPLFDEAGNVRGVINACVDITERKALEDRLQQVEKYQSLALMAGGIAHDFNNLLTVIIGNAATVATALPPTSPAGKAIVDLQIASTQAAELVARLLAFTGRFWCEVKPVALSLEIEKLAPQIRAMIPEPVSVVYALDAELPLIQAGSAELQQVIESLVSNAVEALDPKRPGKIEIRTSRWGLTMRDIQRYFADQPLEPGPYVRLEISDNGGGIPDEILARVFDPFFTTKFVGRGLGLSSVQGILRAHGGAIRLESTADHGTRVELLFPAYVPSAAPSMAATRLAG